MHRHTPVYHSENVCHSYSSASNTCIYPGLKRLIEKVDEQYMKETTGKRSSAFKAFLRVVCSLVKCDPRPNAPTWAVKPLYQQCGAS